MQCALTEQNWVQFVLTPIAVTDNAGRASTQILCHGLVYERTFCVVLYNSICINCLLYTTVWYNFKINAQTIILGNSCYRSAQCS